MRKNKIGKFFLITAAFAGFVLVAGLVVMSLWNWLMPALFGLTTITFAQALGLFVLAKILFGFGGGKMGGGGPRRGAWSRKFKEKWENMSEEEREKFKECRSGRFGRWKSEAAPNE